MERGGEQFLHQRDGRLHTTAPVAHEQERRKRAGEKVTQQPAEKIADWLGVIEKTHMGHEDDPRVLERIKKYYHKQYVIRPEDIPESYFEKQREIARELGHGDIEITDEARRQATEVIITDQESTLDAWIEYFTSPDSSSFPTWAKYWAFNGMLKLSSFDKEKHVFNTRDKGTVAPFPDLNREALAYVIDMIVKKVGKESIEGLEDNDELKQLLAGANFGKLYAYAIEKVTPTEQNLLTNTSGQWVKYEQGSDHMPLVQSLQGFGTGWCTAGESTAKAQLQGGDFYVYYSLDLSGKPTIPRAAIRMQGGSIAEVRGIAPDQNLDPFIGEVVREKMEEFPDGKAYEKKASDMKFLTEIDHKTKAGKALTKEELIFLYEIDAPIEGFGYQRDLRIQEIRSTRNAEEDAPIVLDCQPEEIAWSQQEITENTKAYIGGLYPGIFQQLAGIEHIYTSFPEGKIRRQKLEIGERTTEQLKEEFEKRNINISTYALDMLNSTDFQTNQNAEEVDLVRLQIKDLELGGYPTTDQVYARAEELGLEICPAEVGPQLRLQDSEQVINDWYLIGMKPISDRYGGPDVFGLERDDDGLWLDSYWAIPGYEWSPDYQFVFRLRKVSQES